jgi:hypothetical protein
VILVIALEEARGEVLGDDLGGAEFVDQDAQSGDQSFEVVGRGAVDGGHRGDARPARRRVGPEPELHHALEAVAFEAGAVDAAIGQAHEDERDPRIGGERRQRDRVPGDGQGRAFPLVGLRRHLRIGPFGARFPAAPVWLGPARVARGEEDGPHATAAGDVAVEVGALESSVSSSWAAVWRALPSQVGCAAPACVDSARRKTRVATARSLALTLRPRRGWCRSASAPGEGSPS